MNPEYPHDFIQQIRLLWGEEAGFFLDSIQQPPATSVRLNPFKIGASFENETPIPWCKGAYQLAERPEFIFDPLLHAGAYYVQESSSMFLHHVFQSLNKPQSLKVLDLCAAPGGKSTLLNSCLTPDDLLVSNEIIRTRAGILEENLMKWGQPNVVVTQNDPKDFAKLQHFFDVIVVDAPCSGEGLFRRDKNAMTEWSLSNVALCEARQQRIVVDIIDCLKPGGYLIYSTCTYNVNENEHNIRWMKEQFGLNDVKIEVPSNWPVQPSLEDDVIAYRFLPHKVNGEGLFMACLQKPDGEIKEHRHKSGPEKNKLNPTHKSILNEWVEDGDRFWWFDSGTDIFGLPIQHVQSIELLKRTVSVKNAGIRMGSFAGKDLIPAHHLALSCALSQSVQRLDVSKEDAIRFMRKDVLNPSSNIKGWTAITYQNLPLGWAKVLPNRLNNYLPAHLRILKEYKY